ncbi:MULTISPECIES: hypothetical protein [unclassified Leifsonia]|uniref:hypothetical protein n=1 Tax=unclassified Leifsonia TaxID=2663824 RepID=UPI0008A7F038|nr:MULTISPECIES: hypothetical protein [unclassified Leifsonia]SEI00264.1 hypothetical protein SAMN04515694_10993 [Leifsonia sp. CL154]SFL66847.1 hypothetical protein SAMN04515692_10942 [Leifsonia sp. CL147]
MSEAQAARGPGFGVIRVQPRERRTTVDFSEQKNIDAFYESARKAAQLEREGRKAAAHKSSGR